MNFVVRKVPVLGPEGSIVASRCLKLSDDILFLLSSDCHLAILDMGDITFLSKQTISMLVNLKERFEAAGGYLALSNPRDVVRNLISLRRSQSGLDFFHTTLEAEAYIIEEFGDVDFVYIKNVVDFQMSLARHGRDALSQDMETDVPQAGYEADYPVSDESSYQVSDESSYQVSDGSSYQVSDGSSYQVSETPESQITDEEESLIALAKLAEREELERKLNKLQIDSLKEEIDREIILGNSVDDFEPAGGFSYEEAVSSVSLPLVPPSPEELQEAYELQEPDELHPLEEPLESGEPEAFAEVGEPYDLQESDKVEPLEEPLESGEPYELEYSGELQEPDDAESLALGTYALLSNDSNQNDHYEEVKDEGSLPDEDNISLLKMSDSELSDIVKAHKEVKSSAFDFILEPDPLSDSSPKEKIPSKLSDLFKSKGPLAPMETVSPFESADNDSSTYGNASFEVDDSSSKYGNASFELDDSSSTYGNASFELDDSSSTYGNDSFELDDSSSTYGNDSFETDDPVSGGIDLTAEKVVGRGPFSEAGDDFDALCIEIKSDNPKRRWYAVRSLGRLDDTRGIMILEKLLKSGNDFDFVKDMARLSLTRLNKLYNPMK